MPELLSCEKDGWDHGGEEGFGSSSEAGEVSERDMEDPVSWALGEF